MRITSIETIATCPPIRHVGTLGVGTFDHAESVIVRVRTDERVEGVGEASMWAPFTDNLYAAKETIDRYLAPAIIGMSPADTEAIGAAMERAQHGASSAKAAVDMACLDASARALDVPLHRLLGGLVRDRISLSYSVTNQEIEADLAEIRWLLEQGFHVLKIKTGVLPEPVEIERMARIRELVGDDFDLRVDFNQGAPRERASVLCHALEQFRPTFIEQPVKGFDLSEMRALADALRTPLMADESVMSLQDGLRVVAGRAADIVSIKLMKLGGITQGKKLAAVCEAAGMPCYAGAMWESGIGIAASLHLTCSSPNVRYGSDYYTCSHLLEDDLIVEPLRVENGDLVIPDGPGLGIDVDWDAIERYRVA
jgi:muconate cycloisomerase